MTYSELFHHIYYARRALQELAALEEARETCIDCLYILDALASRAWREFLRSL